MAVLPKQIVIGTSAGETLDYSGVPMMRFVLQGLGGDDRLIGASGDDTLAGGEGADSLDGGAGYDWARYGWSTAAVTLSLVTGTGSGGAAQGDSLVSIEALIGSSFDDHLTGDAGDNWLVGGRGDDTLIGGAGNDRIKGGLGGDYMDGGAGFDWAIYRGSATNLILNTRDHRNARAADGDTLVGIEGIIGTDLNDSIIVGDEANRVRGLDGDDFIDTGAGNDTLIGGVGRDFLHGGEGQDVAVYRWSDAAVHVDMVLGGLSGGHAQFDTLSWIEDVTGSQFDDVLIGNRLANVLSGLAGNDTLDGAGGNDILLGGAGNDVITAVAGADTVWAGIGDDIVHLEAAGAVVAQAGFGDDQIILTGANGAFANGGMGDDVIIVSDQAGLVEDVTVAGAGGADRFVFDYRTAQADADEVTLRGFNPAEDRLQFTGDFTQGDVSVVSTAAGEADLFFGSGGTVVTLKIIGLDASDILADSNMDGVWDIVDFL